GGMISSEVVGEAGWFTQLSVFNVVTSSWAVSLYFAISAGAIVCLGLGVSPRVAAVVVFIWHLSFTYRAIPGCTGWDHVLRAYSFLVMVSPLGASWSLRGGSPTAALVPGYGISLMRLQVALIYWQGIIVKLGDKYWQDGEFLSYFLLSVHARWPHRRVAELNDLLIPVTYIAILIEIAIPILLFVPRTRRLGFLLGFTFHLLIAIMSRHILFFSLTMWMTYVAFIDTRALDRIEALVRSKFGRSKVGEGQAASP
ncbi:MAG: HTTM domain-containing protein, partial [Verrucomicrobiales bacterium]